MTLILQTGSVSMSSLDFAFDSITVEQLFYLYERDGLVEFRCKNMPEDALRYWLKNPGPKSEDNESEMKLAVNYAELCGWSVVVHYDENDDLKSDLLDESILCKSYHPLCNDEGVKDPTKKQLDKQGNPKEFTIRMNGEDYPVDASRCVVFTAKKSTNSWKAPPAILGSLGDIIALRKGRSAYSNRADDLAAAATHVHKSGEMGSDEEDKWEDALEGKNHVVTSEDDKDVKYEYNRLEPALLPSEFVMTREGHYDAIAASWGVPKAFVIGAVSGQKLSTDANQGMYYLALKDIQKQYKKPIKSCVDMFGEPFEGFNDPTQMPIQDKINNLVLLVGTFNTLKDLEQTSEIVTARKVIMDEIKVIGEM